jgi:DNA-directed RNA polymerase subunit RPC12/RpoP
MARFACPNCARNLQVPHYVVQGFLRCPKCSQVFAFPPRRATTEQSAAPPQAASPLLAPCHQCQHCASPIQSPVGRSAATVVCPSCGNKTSVYAVLHRCPSCGMLLESPSRFFGAETECPACKSLLRVPRDLLLKEAPPHPDEFWFGFYCLSCSEEVATREKDVGAYVVCPHCRTPLVVPHSGHYLKGAEQPTPPRDPLDSLHPAKKVVCMECQTRFPASALACPACGARTATFP